MFSQKVTISTCHGAKGLEWPVVMVPAGSDTSSACVCSLLIFGTKLNREHFHFIVPMTLKRKGLWIDSTNASQPFADSVSWMIDRRLLYVACTRAQGLLYLSHAAKRKVAGETKTKEVSEFISIVTKQDQVSNSGELRPCY